MATRYGIDSSPPLKVLLPAALQHLGLAAVTLEIPRLVAETAGADASFVNQYISLAMLAVGIATLLQAFGRRGIGSGQLLPSCFSGIYLAPALILAAQGGLPAVAGFAIVAGLTEICLSLALRRIRAFFPSEVIGFVVFLIGIGWGTLGLKLMTGQMGRPPGSAESLLGFFSLAITIVISLWGPKTWRPLAVLVGLLTGCVTAAVTFFFGGTAFVSTPDWHVIDWTWPLLRPEFHLAFLPAFIVGGIASFLRASGDVVASHQVSDANWKRADVRKISAGTLAEGMGSVIAGILGVMPIDTSSGSVGLVAASGIASRRVAVAAGLLWIVLGLWPTGATWVLAIPPAVAGAAICFTGAFVIRTGTNIMTQRLLDNRRTLTIGLALLIGLSFDQFIPGLGLPPSAKMIFASSLLTGVVVAIILNALLRFGIHRSVEETWNPAEGHAALRTLVDDWGRKWGARADHVRRAQDFLEEFAESVPVLCPAGTPVLVRATYDEVSLRFELRWQGEPVSPAGPLTAPSLDTPDETFDHSLAIALMRHRADHLSFDTTGPGMQRAIATLDDY